MFRFSTICCGLLLVLCPSVAIHAADSTRAVVSPLATLGKLAIALIIVLAVFWVFARVMRQLQTGRGGAHRSLKVVGGLSLGQRERVVVVQAGDEQLVLGVTSTQINILHTLSTPLSVPPTEDVSDFKVKLSAALKRQVVS